MPLADSHVHLHAYDDVPGLLARARSAGVEVVVGIPIELASSRRTIEIAKSHAGVVAAVGLHPAYLATDVPESDLAEIESLARDPSVGFIGEIGLDLVEGTASLDVQRSVFERQLDLAQRLDLPVNLHIRGGFDEAFALLRRGGVPRRGAVVHYFVGDEALARRALDLGLLLSVGKPVARPENSALQRAIRAAPLDRLLLETDSYPLPGRQTEPADVRLVAEAVARLQGRSAEEVGKVTTANLRRMIIRDGAA